MTPQLSLGIIGHVDHGKTSLVKALSGTDTDRLKEEKERGMSIVLGFAYLQFPEGVIDLIDVPGHETFIRTMVSGATGIQAALLVVGANEGIKPQTVEHLSITELIGVRHGAIAITKADLASPQKRKDVLMQLNPLLKGTYLEFAPKVFTSVMTGEGLDHLRSTLNAMLLERRSLPASASFWLPVDRVFSAAGRGTVVTGTLRLGKVRVGDEVEIMPRGARSVVREIEVHGCKVEEAQPGQRTGVNLRHVKADEVRRGDALASIGLLQPSPLIDAQVRLLKDQEKPLHHGQPLRLLFGTTDVLVHVRMLSEEAIKPGQTGIVQFRTEQPVSAIAGEPFILRTDSPAMTVGGGRFLDPAPVRHRRSNQEAMARLLVLAAGSTDAVMVELLKAAGYGGMHINTLATKLGWPVTKLVDAASANSAIMLQQNHALYKPLFASLCDMVGALLQKFHRQQPLRHGATMSHCRACLPKTVSDQLFKAVLATLCDSKLIEVRRGMVCTFGYDPVAMLPDEDRHLAAMMEIRFKQGGFTPPDVAEITSGDARLESIFHMLVERGVLLSLQSEQPDRKVAFHAEVIREANRRLRENYPPPVQFTVSEARALLGSTRKFMVPMLEHFDAAGLTRRRGDKRVMTGNAGCRG